MQESARFKGRVMSDKPHLTLFDTTPLDNLTKESLEDFKQWVLQDEIKPSVALRRAMKKYNCPKIHTTSVVHFLNLTYPNIDIGHGGFRFRIVDSAYPDSDPNQFSDDDFDKGIEELLKHPTGGW